MLTKSDITDIQLIFSEPCPDIGHEDKMRYRISIHFKNGMVHETWHRNWKKMDSSRDIMKAFKDGKLDMMLKYTLRDLNRAPKAKAKATQVHTYTYDIGVWDDETEDETWHTLTAVSMEACIRTAYDEIRVTDTQRIFQICEQD